MFLFRVEYRSKVRSQHRWSILVLPGPCLTVVDISEQTQGGMKKVDCIGTLGLRKQHTSEFWGCLTPSELTTGTDKISFKRNLFS